MTSLRLAAGQLVGSSLRVVRPLHAARSGGSVLLPWDEHRAEHEGRPARLLVLPTRGVPGAATIARFVEAARSAEGASHHGLPRVIEAGFDPAIGAFFVANPWAQGESLVSLVLGGGAFTGGRAHAILVTLGGALGALHRAGIVHGGVHPARILGGRDASAPDAWRFVLLDAGLTAFCLGPGGDALAAPLGPDPYRAPELGPGATASPAADVFSLGVLAVYLVTGVPVTTSPPRVDLRALPWHGRLLSWVARARGRGRYDVRAEPWIEGFATWYARATATAVNRRFPDAEAALDALGASVPLDRSFGSGPRHPPAEAPPPASEPPPPAPPPPAPSPPVSLDDWEALLTAALGSGVTRSEMRDGVVVRLAAGTRLVEIDYSEDHISAGGVVWTPGWGQKRSTAVTLFRGVVEAARLAEGARRIGARSGGPPAVWRRLRGARGTWIEDVLRGAALEPVASWPGDDERPWSYRRDDRDGEAPGQRWAGAAWPGTRVTLAGDTISVAREQEEWVSSHELGIRGRTYAVLTPGSLPASRSRAVALLRSVLALAPAIDDRPLHPCRLCGREVAPIQFNVSLDACHSCAESRLGVCY